MKKITFTIIILLFVSHFSYAQWTISGTTNTYYNLSGNVGIGINGSTAKFAVYQPTALGSVIKNSLLLSSIAGSAANSFQSNLWLVRNAAGSDFTTARLHDGISIDNSFLTPQTNTLTWWERDPTNDIQSWGNAANTYLTISKGNVGIGTTTPKEALSVNGNIRSKQVKVELANWPDYVFKPNYQLPSLNEVKAYIDQNQHLPEIPTAEEIAKNGLNLGEMNQLLMKKVEELTLYLIEKDTKEKEQEAVNNGQQKQINLLIKQVETLRQASTKN